MVGGPLGTATNNLGGNVPNVETLLAELESMAAYYIGVPQQRIAYDKLLLCLGGMSADGVSQAQVDAITKARRKIEQRPLLKFPKIELPPERGLKKGDLVYHRVKHYVGRLDGTTAAAKLFEDPQSSREYRVVLPGRSKEPRLIAAEKNLEVVSTIGAAAPHERGSYQSQCWKCKSPIDYQLERCPTCGWYMCFHCGACGCGFKRRSYGGV